jgi:hypothetical protein
MSREVVLGKMAEVGIETTQEYKALGGFWVGLARVLAL